MATTLDRLSAQVDEMAEHLDGLKVEIVRGVIMLSPRRPFHGETVFRLWNILGLQLPEAWKFVTDVASPIRSANSAPTSPSSPLRRPTATSAECPQS